MVRSASSQPCLSGSFDSMRVSQKCRNQAGRRRVIDDFWKKTEKKTATLSNQLKSSTFGPAVTHFAIGGHEQAFVAGIDAYFAGRH